MTGAESIVASVFRERGQRFGKLDVRLLFAGV
jgi:hypothetical protein